MTSTRDLFYFPFIWSRQFFSGGGSFLVNKDFIDFSWDFPLDSNCFKARNARGGKFFLLVRFYSENFDE